MNAQSAHSDPFNLKINKGNKFTESRNKRVTFMSGLFGGSDRIEADCKRRDAVDRAERERRGKGEREKEEGEREREKR